ncbi:MAG: TIGR03564 family F420-dependent LLM class oxidoreductase [Chloroflexi bacterium]|nr:TIGR03564 family F420-dependent LLM class oxidoreductase [Chloroflexota bacterium]
MRIGLFAGLSSRDSIDDLLNQITRAEQDGFASAWTANIFNHDALIVLALAGRATHRIELGTAVVPTYPRHPVALAQQALTAQAASQNRLALGIGLSHRVVIEGMLGLDFSKPVRHMREYLTVLNDALAGQPTSFQGEEYRIANTQIGVPGATKPPVIVAALGEQMLRLAGRLSDGTITWMGGAKYLETSAIPVIRKAAQDGGRPAPRIVVGLPVAVTSQRDAARTSASKGFAMYGRLPSYRAILDKDGAADPADVAIIGSEDEVMAQVQHLAAIGATDFIAAPYVVRDDPEAFERTYQLMARAARMGA